MFTAEHIDAVADYNLRVVAATVDYPQSAPGTAMTAGEAMRHIYSGSYTGEEFSSIPLTEFPHIFTGMMQTTSGIHRIVGRPVGDDAPKIDLRAATSFSDEIIKAATRVAVDAYADGEIRDTLYLPTLEGHIRFDSLTAERTIAKELEAVFNFGATVAFEPGGEALKLAKQFRDNLKANNAALLEKRLPYGEYLERKIKLQLGIGVAVNNLVLRELDTTPNTLRGVSQARARAALTSLFVAMPDPSFPRHFFAESKPA